MCLCVHVCISDINGALRITSQLFNTLHDYVGGQFEFCHSVLLVQLVQLSALYTEHSLQQL